jgi:hypothetical protein
MFVFAIKCLLGILLIIWVVMMFVEIFKKNPTYIDVKNKILYIKEHRETFGISDVDVYDDDFANKNIVVLTPDQLGLNSTGGGAY